MPTPDDITSLDQIKLRIMQIKGREEENTKDLLEIADHMHRMHLDDDSSKAHRYLGHKESIINANTAKIIAIEHLDTDVTTDIKQNEKIDGRAERRLRGLVPL